MRTGQSIELDGFELTGADLLVDVEANEGWSASEDGGYATLIDTTITAELAAEGFAREIVRRLQDLRRDAEFEISDRIHVSYQGDAEVQAVFAAHGDYISEETLALSVEDAAAADSTTSVDVEIDGHAVTLAVTKA